MTTPSTGDARAEERVVEAVAIDVAKEFYGTEWLATSSFRKQICYGIAIKAIEAYRKAMRE